MQNPISDKKKIIAGILERDGKVMIARRAKKDCFEGKWEFPGGKMEAGETDHETLRRELNEEFGIHAQVGEFVCAVAFEYKGMPAEMLAYKVPSYEGALEMREHSAIVWVTPQELSEYEFPEPDLPIIALLQGKNCRS